MCYHKCYHIGHKEWMEMTEHKLCAKEDCLYHVRFHIDGVPDCNMLPGFECEYVSAPHRYDPYFLGTKPKEEVKMSKEQSLVYEHVRGTVSAVELVQATGLGELKVTATINELEALGKVKVRKIPGKTIVNRKQ